MKNGTNMTSQKNLVAVSLSIAALTFGCAKATKVDQPDQPKGSSRAGLTTPDALLTRVSKSLVAVRYTYEAEMGRRDIEGSGIIVREDGLVAFPMSLIPTQMPESQAVDFKVIIPADIDGPEQVELPAVYQGRDERADLAYVKITSEKPWRAIKPSERKLRVGEPIFSVGLLPKNSGYTPYVRRAEISSILRGPIPLILTAGGLCVVGSPVFDQTGAMIGIVSQFESQSPLLNGDDENQSAALLLPPIFFTPASYYSISLNTPPAPETPVKMPWLGVSQMNGLTKEVGDYYGLGSKPAIQVGDVVPRSSADAGGLKAGDVIVSFNGRELERGDQPAELPMILGRQLGRLQVGEEVSLGVIREPNGEIVDLKFKLDQRPPIPSSADRFWAEDLGYTVRGMVFSDRYARKLEDDFTGVVVTFIRPNSAAQAGSLSRGDVITKFGQSPVESVEKFKAEYEAFRKEKSTEPVVFEVLRGTDTQIIRIEPPR